MKVLLKKESRLVVVAAALAVANFLFYLLAVYPLQHRVDNREDDYNRLRQRLADLRADAALTKRVEEGKIAVEELRGQLPTKDDLPSLIREIHALAREYDLKIPSVKYEPKREKGDVMTHLLITLPVVGEYPDIRRFIHDLEISKRLVMLDNMGISTAGGTGKAGGTQLQLTMSTYVRPAALPEKSMMPREGERGPR